MNPIQLWQKAQADIDSCSDCRRIGGSLFASSNQNPARPSYTSGRPVLFLSEAPPSDGGFWAPHPNQDDLRTNLFGILRDLYVPLPKDDHARQTLADFLAMGFSLIQTIKWLLQNSARNLRPVERDLISHSVQAHLLSELQLLCPLAIVCLGKVAAYACGLCFSGSQFKFASSTRLEAIRGKRFDVAVTPSLQAHLYSTELPVKRRMGNRQKIVDEIRQVIKDHWSVQLGHII